MPTAAKLVAAMALALAAFGVSGVLLYRYEYFSTHGMNAMIFVGVGAFVGWWRLGPQAEKGYRAGWSGGVAAALTSYLLVVSLATGAFVLRGMDRHHYKDIEELMNGVFTKFLEYAMFLFDWPVFTITVFSGLLAGTFAAMAGRLWT